MKLLTEMPSGALVDISPEDLAYLRALQADATKYREMVKPSRKKHGPPYTVQETFFPAGYYTLRDLEDIVKSMKKAIKELEK